MTTELDDWRPESFDAALDLYLHAIGHDAATSPEFQRTLREWRERAWNRGTSSWYGTRREEALDLLLAFAVKERRS